MQNVIKKKLSAYDKISVVALFLMALNIKKLELYILVCIFFFYLFIRQQKTLVVNKTSVSIMLFSFAYTFILIIKGYSLGTSVLTYLICPIAAYYVGFMLVNKNNIKNLDIFLLAIVLGRATHGLMNMWPYLGGSYTARNPIDYWTGEALSSTGAGALLVAAASLIYYSLYIFNNGKRVKGIFLFAMSLMSIISAVYMGTRGCIVVALFTFFLCVLKFTPFKNNNSRRIIFTVFLLLIIFYIAYSNNLFGLQTLFTNSGLYRRIYVYDVESLQANVRWERQWYMLTHLFSYPFGADELSYYTHNMWLDIARVAGLIPFVLSLVMTIYMVKSIRNAIKSDLLKYEKRILLFSVSTGIFMLFFVEPILEGMPSFFLAFVMVAAMADKTLRLFIGSQKVM